MNDTTRNGHAALHPFRRARFAMGLVVALLCLTLATPALAGDGRWFHVRIDEGRGDGEVSINIPLSLIQSFLPFVERQLAEESDFDMDFGDIEGLDLLQLFEALRDAPDANFVTVRSQGEDVVVAKEKGFLVVRARDGRDRVTVQMPMEVVEILADQSGRRQLDLGAALDALASYDDIDLVRVESDDSLVRIWIDGDEQGER